MSDIIMEMPWNSDDGWYRTYYCVKWDAPGYTVGDEDGDHEDIGEEDLPSYEEHDKAWKSYHEDVAETGSDPLCNFILDYTYKVPRRYKVELRNSLGGVMVCRWKWGRKAWSSGPMPKAVADYLLCYKYDDQFNQVFGRRPLKDPNPGVKTADAGYRWDEFIEIVKSDKTITKITRSSRGAVLHLVLEEEMTRKESTISRELMKLARKALK